MTISPEIAMPPSQRFRIRTPSLTFDEFPFDMVFGYELLNRKTQHVRHRDRFDQIGAGLRERLPRSVLVPRSERPRPSGSGTSPQSS